MREGLLELEGRGFSFPIRLMHSFVPSTDCLFDNKDNFFSFKPEETRLSRPLCVLCGKTIFAWERPRTPGNQLEVCLLSLRRNDIASCCDAVYFVTPTKAHEQVVRRVHTAMSAHVFNTVSNPLSAPAREVQSFPRYNDDKARIALAIAEQLLESIRRGLRVYFYDVESTRGNRLSPDSASSGEGRRTPEFPVSCSPGKP